MTILKTNDFSVTTALKRHMETVTGHSIQIVSDANMTNVSCRDVDLGTELWLYSPESECACPVSALNEWCVENECATFSS